MDTMEQLNRLVRMVARGFYEDVSLEEDQSKPNGSGSCGIVVVVLDALTRQQWVREEDLARSLMIPFNRLRQITHFLEQQKLVRRYYRKEAIHDASISTASPSHVSHDAHLVPTNVAGKLKMIMQPYCCLHYGQVYDVTLYRIHEMKKKLKDELDGNYMIQNYVCPNCERRYSSLNALDLVSHIDNNFHCKHCNEELSQDFGDLAWGGRGGDGDNARRDRHAKLKDFLQRMEHQMERLISQLNKVKDLDFPEFLALETWERNMREPAGGDDVSRPMLFLGEVMSHEHQKGSASCIDADEEIFEFRVQDARPIPSFVIRKDINHTEDKEEQL
ncbi:transcription initiation factor IIE subunit alpha isoform X1 [Oryza sativa Japonica Group]|uniref:HTH TFE/IIEalpha-type domain-containing protein n=4 Tax=Oryza sativa TaxID=4530 RepID=A3C8F6_ORYSJ|nr:transcription initiation factor IIE subunit alpha isoform X1 [Oryza sativa Japonica Group]EAY79859.1 hypothetical protein OsI_35020 [Oryza sativa Indica Group]EAZ17369.1 hypothetical protein OsJ_32892 [Oryza sativa Japonica Group]